jgi:hypothetical protein
MVSRRNIFLALALVATVVASVVDFAPPEAVDTAGIALPVASKTAAPPAAPINAALRRDRFATPAAQAAGSPADLFPVRSWLPPPPVAQAAPAPKAPPLPFKYLGKVLEEGVVVAFVSEGTRTHLLRKGDALPPYRVDNVTPQELTLVYLPLNETQRLNFGSAN